MDSRNGWIMCVALSLGVAALLPQQGRAQKDGDDDVDVQLRGPVHEAFAQPVVRGAIELQVIAEKPPPDVPELVPDEMPEGAVWLPGYWGWDEDSKEYLWVTGTARVPPPGRAWAPGYWRDVSGGWTRVPGYWSEAATVEIVPPPPDPIPESPPPPPDAHSTYVPGCWVYRETRYWWRPGFWIGFRPGWVWSPAHYVPCSGGYVFVEGCWDHDFYERGLVFAPVRIHPRFYGRPGWHYRPHYALYGDFILGSLFVHRSSRHYYFGNYYEPRYVRAGYLPWIDFRIGDRYHDHLYSYHRWHHRDNPDWERGLRTTLVARREGKAPPPPLTLRAAATASADTKAIGAPLASFKSSAVTLKPVPATRQKELAATAAHLRKLSVERNKLERDLSDGKSLAPKGGGKGAAAVKLDLPKIVGAGKPDVKPPPPPVPPKPVSAPKDLPKTKDIPKTGDPKDIPKGVPKTDVPKTGPKEVPKDLPKTKPLKTKDDPKDLPKTGTKEVPKDLPKTKPPKDLPKTAPPKEFPKDLPKTIPPPPPPKPVPPPPAPKPIPKPPDKGKTAPPKKTKDGDDSVSRRLEFPNVEAARLEAAKPFGWTRRDDQS